MTRNVHVRFRPLTQWPAGRARTPASDRVDGRKLFKRGGAIIDGNYVSGAPTSIEATYDELDRELWQIGADDAVVQLDVRSERELRSSDGYPLAKAVMRSPAAVLSFTRDGTPFVFATDYFAQWESNLRAIVLGLEGLRRIERYHIGQAGDQYRGWQALPATTTSTMDTEAAAIILFNHGGFSVRDTLLSVTLARSAYRAAAAAAHPDRPGGGTESFQLVQDAKRVLEAHHGAKL